MHPGCDLQECRSCATRFLDPQPSDERLAEIYGPGYYDPWGMDHDASAAAIKASTMGRLLDEAGLSADERVLDVGCATGSLAELVVKRGAKAFGVDLNPIAIKGAIERVPTGHFHCGVLSEQPFPGVEFDLVTLVDCIEHFRAPEVEMVAVAQRLAPGGRVLLSTPRIDSLLHRLMGSAWPQYREEHLTYFSRRGMEALLQRCGLTAVSVRPTSKALTLGYACRQAEAYSHPVITPAMRVARRVGAKLADKPLTVRLGEMTVLAQRIG